MASPKEEINERRGLALTQVIISRANEEDGEGAANDRGGDPGSDEAPWVCDARNTQRFALRRAPYLVAQLPPVLIFELMFRR